MEKPSAEVGFLWGLQHAAGAEGRRGGAWHREPWGKEGTRVTRLEREVGQITGGPEGQCNEIDSP